MALIPFLAKKPLLAEPDRTQIVNAICAAEKMTSGEVRVFVESRCKFVDPLDRARELFYSLQMEATANRNAVLIYVAIKDQQLAVFADEGIYHKAGTAFWNKAVASLLQHFNQNDYGAGIASVVTETGNLLQTHFPYDSKTDKNELPDDIVFGK
ncbi:MAG: TPM domain-containing protein [Bacteroidota bacterium]